MARIHDLVAHRQTIGELTGYSNPVERIIASPLACVVKLFRLSLGAVSCDDPPVDQIADLEVSPDDLPRRAHEKIGPLAEALEQLGFRPSICHSMLLPNMQTELFQIWFRRSDGQVAARITYRHWIPQAKHRLFVTFVSVDRSGATVLTTNGRLDCLQPPAIHVERKVDERVPELLRRHEDAALKQVSAPLRLTDDATVRRVAEDLHEQFRQYQLDRGTYAPVRENSPKAVRLPDVAKRKPPATVVTISDASEAADSDEPLEFAEEAEPESEHDEGPPHDEVTEEIVRLMNEEANKKASTAGNILLLLVSLGAFIAFSKGQNDWSWTWLLVPALLIHELGHLLTMRACGYHNTKIFFIPFFGAAASGINFNVPGWKRVLVSLAGPIPGLAFGILSGVAGMIYDQPLLTRFGAISCILNVFNLIPVMPLDGGWVGFHVLFCRHPLLDAAFRACGAFALFLIALATRQIPLGILSFSIFISAFRAFKIGDVARRLQREGIELAEEDNPGLDQGLATRAAVAIRRAYMNVPKLANKALATASLEVYSLIHARPPSALASLFFGAVQAGGFFVGLVGLVVFVAADNGHFGQFLQAAARQPRHEYTCGSSEEWAGKDAHLPSQESVQIVALCDSDVAARNLFATLQRELTATDRVASIGPCVFITLPAAADAAREREIQRLTEQNVKFHVVSPDMGSSAIRITALATGADAAESIVSELQTFSRLGSIANLIPPWSARWRAGGADIDRFRKARASFLEIQKVSQSSDDAGQDEIKQKHQQARTARRLGRREEARKLDEEIVQLQEDSRISAMEKLLANAGNDLDPECLQLYLAWHKESQVHWREQRQKADDRFDGFDAYKLESYRPLQARLGTGANDDLETLRVTARGLVANHTGLVVEIHWLQLVNEGDGLRSVLEWLCQQRCTTIKFEADAPGLLDMADD